MVVVVGVVGLGVVGVGCLIFVREEEEVDHRHRQPVAGVVVGVALRCLTIEVTTMVEEVGLVGVEVGVVGVEVEGVGVVGVEVGGGGYIQDPAQEGHPVEWVRCEEIVVIEIETEVCVVCQGGEGRVQWVGHAVEREVWEG